MSALREAVSRANGQASLAAAIGVKQQHIWNWLHRSGQVPPEHCAAIHAATGVPRWELRPDDWHRIWPELVGAAGAPAVPEQQVA